VYVVQAQVYVQIVGSDRILADEAGLRETVAPLLVCKGLAGSADVTGRWREIRSCLKHGAPDRAAVSLQQETVGFLAFSSTTL
jgi:hypothetical protein